MQFLSVKWAISFISAPYVKVYLVKGRKCVAKQKTSIARKTLDPLYQQQLVFHEDYRGCVLQVNTFPLLLAYLYCRYPCCVGDKRTL